MTTEANPLPNLLVIDDDPDFLKMMRSVMGKLFSRIHIAGNGAEGMRLAENEPIDIILIEAEMKWESGFTLCSRLNETDPLSRIPVILISSGYNNLSRETLESCGAADFVAKPFKPRELHERIMNVLTGESLEPDAGSEADTSPRR